MKNFDTDLFIREIQKRPSIWNTHPDVQTNPVLRRKNWNEVIDIFGGDKLPSTDRNLLGFTLRKKWKSLRVCFARELKRQKNYGSGVGRKSEYMYYKQLKFLTNVMNIVEKETTENKPEYVYYDEKDSELSEPLAEVECIEDVEDIEINEQLNEDPDNDEDYLFLLSLHKTLKSIPKNKKISVKIKMLSILHEAMSQDDDDVKN